MKSCNCKTGITEKELDLKLKEQHRNTRHDAIDVVNQHWAKFLEKCLGKPIAQEVVDEITRDIHNLPQRKP